VGSSLAGARVIVELQGPLRRRVASEDDEVSGRSLPELNEAYRRQWHSGSAREDAAAAAAELLALRAAIIQCAELAVVQDWEALGVVAAEAPMDGGSVERIFDTLARADSLAKEQREEIGWNWGACGWRRDACGAAADVEEALAELRIRNGMLLPREALFVLDVALRGVDSAIAAAATAGLVDKTEVAADRRSLAQVMSDRMSADGDDDEGGDDGWAAANPELARELEEMLSDEEKMDAYLELDSEVGNTIV